MILHEYLKTVFFGEAPPSGWPRNFHIITAHNPKRVATEAENNAADIRLLCQLQEQQIKCFRLTGCSVDLLHQEAGWAVVGLSLNEAVAIGRGYVQNAIFEVSEGETYVVSCDTLERTRIGDFQGRLRLPPSNSAHSTKESMTSEETQCR